MSIEPTCDFCNACDKFRCRTQEEADKCESFAKDRLIRDVNPERPLPRAELNALPKVSLTKDLGVGTVTVQTHQAGEIARLSVSIERPGHGSGPVNFTLQPQDVDAFIDTIRKAQTYSKKGQL